MYGERINKDKSPKFLGIRFDPFLSGKNQIKYIKSAYIDRLNILKIVQHKSWQIDTNTLKQIYQSLVRSLIEYTGFRFNLFSDTSKASLQAIENSALRIIYHKKREFGNNRLLELAGIEGLEHG